jgi:hypothetical protein
MNKITITKEEQIDLKDNAVDIDINVSKLTINVKGKVLINEISKKEQEDLDLIINIEPQSSLIYNRFLIHNIMNNKITINQNSKSDVVFNYSFIANDKCHLTIDSNLYGNDNETEVNVKAVTENDGNATIIGTADTKPKIENNNLVESIKVLMLNEEASICIPNLLVSSNEITVNHACTISSLDKDSLFYLESKGLSKEDAARLIKNGYLIGNLSINDEIKQDIINLIEGE